MAGRSKRVSGQSGTLTSRGTRCTGRTPIPMKTDAAWRVRRVLGLLTGLLAVVAGGFRAGADDLINVDFTAGPASEKVGPAAYGKSATDFWNNYERRFINGNFVGSGTVSGLRLSDGTATGASMTVANAPGAWGNGVDDPMYASYLYPFDGGSITVWFLGLPAGSYDLYLYGHGGPGIDAANSVFEVMTGTTSLGSKATTTGPGWNSNLWEEGQQYVRFTGVAVEDGVTVTVSVSRGHHSDAYLAGMQWVRKTAGPSAPLEIVPHGGTFTNSVRVALVTSVPAAEIRYTVDGAEPTPGSARYQGPFEVVQRTTVRARLFVNGFPASEIVEGVFVPDPGIRMTPPGGRFTNRVDVVLRSRIAGAAVHYTLDGTEPDARSALYSEPVRLTAATTVKARAILNGFPVTEVITGVFQRVYAFENDGIPGDWRTRYFGADYATDPRAGADADPDGDGTPNRQEYAAGTDPLDPLSGFRVGVRAVPEVRFASKAGSSYRILRRGSVQGGESVVVAEVRATGDETTWVDTEAGTVANPAFYTVQPVP